jgi:zinc/manganese transport system substrate-binding protein
MSRMTRLLKTFLIAIAACVAGAAPLRSETQAPLPVVASFSILGDFVKAVGGDRVEVATIVGPNGDAHVYQPTPRDGQRLAKARLVFVNGLGFEGWMDRLVAASKSKAAVVVASKGVAPRQDEGGLDPHAWQDVVNAKVYVANIRDALKAADPASAALYEANAAAYLDRLNALDAEIGQTIDSIPRERRRIVSTHDAFGYFARRYGIEFLAPQGVSTESESSARDVAKIIDAARKQKVTAVFLENVVDPRLSKRIAAETGAKLGGTLFSDALSDANGPAPSYIDMMRHNVKELQRALAP